MRRHSLALFANLLSAAHLVSSQQCSYDCEKCGKTNDFYEITETGLCQRSEAVSPPYDFLLGGFYCSWLVGSKIHDSDTCMSFQAKKQTGGFQLFQWFNFSVNFTDTDGCEITATPPDYIDVEPLKTSVCLNLATTPSYVCLVLGICCGAILATCALCSGRHKVLDDEFVGSEFADGARLIATKTLVRGHGTLLLTLLYRCSQVIANACMPMVIMMYVSPDIVLTLYSLFYVLPGFIRARGEAFHQTFYWITPPKVSLYGINKIDRLNHRWWYYFSAIRTMLFPLSVVITCYCIYKLDAAMGSENPGQFVFNTSIFFRAGLVKGVWAPLTRDSIQALVALGTFTHAVMTVLLLLEESYVDHHRTKYDGAVGKGACAPISFAYRRERHKQIKKLTEQITIIADELANEEEGEKKYTFEKLNEEMLQRDDATLPYYGEVKPLGPLGVMITSGLIVANFLGYFWKVYVMLKQGRVLVAFGLIVVTSQSVIILSWTGVFVKGIRSFPKVMRTGVHNADYLALNAWVKGAGGLPYLLVSVYALPLAGFDPLSNALFVFFFIIKGIVGLALVLVDNVDFDLFDFQNPPEDDSDDEDEDEDSDSEREGLTR